jgi:hypothetical protein
MKGGRIIEVDGAFDQPQPEHSGVEVEVALGIAGDRGNVMNAQNAHAGRSPTRWVTRPVLSR